MNWVLDNYVLVVPPFVLLASLTLALLSAGVGYVRRVRSGAPRPVMTALLEAGLVLMAAAVLAVTLDPRHGDGPARMLDLSVTGRRVHVGHPERQAAERLANLVMLLPPALLAGLRWPRLTYGRRAAVTALGLPLIPEILQFVLPNGRVAALEDAMLGVCGTAAGLTLSRGLRGLTRRMTVARAARQRARTLAAWTCTSCPSESETICLRDSCPTRTLSPFSDPSMRTSSQEPARPR
jgi:hypothetical protein